MRSSNGWRTSSAGIFRGPSRPRATFGYAAQAFSGRSVVDAEVRSARGRWPRAAAFGPRQKAGEAAVSPGDQTEAGAVGPATPQRRA